MYQRALRDNPNLQGKVVLELTIAADGSVQRCEIVSSELNDPELERKLVARVKSFRFEAKDVGTHHGHQADRLLPGISGREKRQGLFCRGRGLAHFRARAKNRVPGKYFSLYGGSR